MQLELSLCVSPDAWPETLLELPEKCWGPLLASDDFAVIAKEIERDFSSDVVPLIGEMLVWQREPTIPDVNVYVRYSEEFGGFVAAEMGRAENLLRTTRFDYGYGVHSFGTTKTEAIVALIHEFHARNLNDRLLPTIDSATETIGCHQSRIDPRAVERGQ
jgi:hypothetical protein